MLKILEVAISDKNDKKIKVMSRFKKEFKNEEEIIVYKLLITKIMRRRLNRKIVVYLKYKNYE